MEKLYKIIKFDKKAFKKSLWIFIIAFVLSLILSALFILSKIDGEVDKNLIINEITFVQIFKNNIIVCACAMLGSILWKIPSRLVLVINPVYLGFIIGGNWAVTGKLLFFLKFVILHGIFEIFAIVLACSLGNKGKKLFKEYSAYEIFMNGILITIVLGIAAFVEVNFSAKLI